MLPCGTQTVIGDWNQSMALSFSPIDLSFFIKSRWSIMSKTFEKSRKRAPVRKPLSFFSRMLSVK